MISAVILTKNNETTLEKTLASVSFCDEILVIDDYSSDGTVAFAKKQKATVIEHHLENDFAKQRNFALEKTKGDWVLFVDSDEIVSEQLKKEIIKKVTSDKSQVTSKTNGYYVRRVDFFMGKELKHGETADVRLLRLAQKGAGKWVRSIHEVWDVQGKKETLCYPLLHYPHPDVAQFLTDINWYSTINAQYFFDTGVRMHGWQIIVYPVAKFFVNYITKLGFLDGTAGMVMALMMSFHSFLTRGKLWELQQKQKN